MSNTWEILYVDGTSEEVTGDQLDPGVRPQDGLLYLRRKMSYSLPSEVVETFVLSNIKKFRKLST